MCMKDATFLVAFVHAVEIGDTGCCILALFTNATQLVAEWLVILMTLDRVVAVWFPFQYRQICTMRHALVAYGFIVVTMVCVNINKAWPCMRASKCLLLPARVQVGVRQRGRLLWLDLHHLYALHSNRRHDLLQCGKERKAAALKPIRSRKSSYMMCDREINN